MYFNDKSNDNITYLINYYSSLHNSSYCNNSESLDKYLDLISFFKSQDNFKKEC